MELSISKVNLKASQFSTLPQNPAEHSRYGNTDTHHHTGAKAQEELVVRGLQKSGPGGRVRAGQPSWFICASIYTALSERRRTLKSFILRCYSKVH